MRASAHPILTLIVVNVGITLYAFSHGHGFVSAALGILLPGAILVGLAQTFRTRVARSNLGVFTRYKHQFRYWLQVIGLIVGYLFASAAPLLIRP